MIKYNIVVCCCVEILANVAAYVIPGYYILCFIILIIHNFSSHNCKFPEDGVLTPKYVGVNLVLILHCLFVRMLV
jgi:hypothetical protein